MSADPTEDSPSAILADLLDMVKRMSELGVVFKPEGNQVIARAECLLAALSSPRELH